MIYRRRPHRIICIPIFGADEWIALQAQVHGAFGAFIPLSIKVGLDASERLKSQPRELSATYYDSFKSPRACFAAGIAIATCAPVGQRSLTTHVIRCDGVDGPYSISVPE